MITFRGQFKPAFNFHKSQGYFATKLRSLRYAFNYRYLSLPFARRGWRGLAIELLFRYDFHMKPPDSDGAI